MQSIIKVAVVLLLISFITIPTIQTRGHSKTRQNQNGEKSEKIDLAIIVDESEAMTTGQLKSTIKLLFRLVKYFSISPGTTRVSLYTVGENFKTHFKFRDHVNRECLIGRIEELVLKSSPRTSNFTENLRTGFDEIKSQHTDIEGQRRIYLYITNKRDDIKLMATELDLDNGDEVSVLLFGKISAKKRKLLREKKNKRKKQVTEAPMKYSPLPQQSMNPMYRHSILEAKSAGNKQTKYSPLPQKNTNPVNRQNIFEVETSKTGNNKQIKTIELPTKIEHILYKINVENKIYGQCTLRKEGKTVIDECNRHCRCQNQKLVDCYRVRKEFTSMTSKERRRYLRTYKTLTTKSPYKETYERFIFMHYKYFCWGIHNRDLFLPWHRWFLSIMEDLLRQIDCGVTIPYWDWSYVSRDPWNRTGLWRSTSDGLGKIFIWLLKNSLHS